MKRRRAIVGIAVVVACAATGFATRDHWQGSAVAKPAAAVQSRPVLVEVVTATRKSLPVSLEALGTVTPLASVAVKARVESAITQVHFEDGAEVKEGDLLFSLDSRQIEIDIKRVEAIVAGERAKLEQAERDVARGTELVAKNAATPVALSNAKTQVAITHASLETQTAVLDNLKLQLSHTRLHAPISGRISVSNVGVGHVIRFTDKTPLATIVQMAPVYVAFTVAQRELPELRRALDDKAATVEVIVPGEKSPVSGQVAMIDNTVDPGTGMVTVRAVMKNEDKVLWPGTLVTVRLSLRNEEVIALPSYAVKFGQIGSYVYVVENGRAKIQRVSIARVSGDETVLAGGVRSGETVVTDGHLLLSENARITLRPVKLGAG
jgi:multidrug efflux system membrane fusion protein